MLFSLHSAFFFSSWKAGRINPVQSTNNHFKSWGLSSFFEGECIIHQNIYMEYVLPQTLNGPHGGVATTMGLGISPTNIEQFSYNNTNFLTCMTLDVENLHASIHHKK